MRKIRIGQKVRTNRDFKRIVGTDEIRGLVVGRMDGGDTAIVKLETGELKQIHREWLESDK